MPLNLTVSPDFTPDHISGWYIFNTWLQKALDEQIHLELYDDFAAQRKAVMDDSIDLIYANPYDAALLVREKNFRPLVKPTNKVDEAIVAVQQDHAAQCVEDLQPGIRIASTDDPDVHLMGMIMLEPADLDKENTERQVCDTYVLVAKELIRGGCEVGFFLDEAYQDLSNMVRSQLRPLVSSRIHIIHHALMVGPRLAERHDEIQQLLIAMQADDKDRGVLESLGLDGWEAVENEDMEFMIDLMDTLEG
ncbi:MAG TPA: phosphate/phosphite/phosphonate ABC transporter substrate-binding protein [Gammaproteobacteria bacterium]|nr:phosphate/phosphite/phosphonate ABC transporter substrate-binding protein [Gammaproteobacteria bacterium]